jgi:uncharacterized protein YdeI (YjbR/CyaY-like superfamily)
MILNPKVDHYIADGCGRCKLYATPQCRVRQWRNELETIRQYALESGLTEDVKWGVPVYTLDGKNVLIVSALKEYCALGFFKGALLRDEAGVLVKQGENTQSTRTMKFTRLSDITQKQDIIASYIREAIQIEQSGLKVDLVKNPEPLVEELVHKLEQDPAFRKAFFALTPGKQRAYNLHFSEPVKKETREKRIEEKVNDILNGIGVHDAYKKKVKKRG